MQQTLSHFTEYFILAYKHAVIYPTDLKKRNFKNCHPCIPSFRAKFFLKISCIYLSLSFLFPLSHELQANFILITPLETGPTVYYSILDILYLLNIMDTSFTPNPVSFSAYIAISSTCT